MRPRLTFFKVMAFIVGIGLLVLVTEMVLSYGFGMKGDDNPLAWWPQPHGFIYMVYLVATAMLGFKVGWSAAEDGAESCSPAASRSCRSGSSTGSPGRSRRGSRRRASNLGRVSDAPSTDPAIPTTTTPTTWSSRGASRCTSPTDRCSSSTSAPSTPSSSRAGSARPSCFSEVVPHSMPVAEMLAKDPAAVILSGGPSSVYEEGAPSLDPALLEAGVPVFGMCYGFQAMARALGGTVEKTGLSRVRGHPGDDPRHLVHPVQRAARRPVGVDEPRRLGVAGARRDGGHGHHVRSAAWPGSRTTRAGSTACSGTPRCCTRRSASRCSRTS